MPIGAPHYAMPVIVTAAPRFRDATLPRLAALGLNSHEARAGGIGPLEYLHQRRRRHAPPCCAPRRMRSTPFRETAYPPAITLI